MPKDDLNVLDALAEKKHEDKYGLGKKLIDEIQSFKGKPFVLIFQPGAGAPVSSFMEEWMKAGLGGCTGELLGCKTKLWFLPIIIVNTLTQAEQAAANVTVKTKTTVDVSDMTIINDPDRLLFKAFDMSPDEMKHVQNRHAYVPQAWVCKGDGKLHKAIQNPPKEPGKVRETEEYFKQIKDETLSLVPDPSYVNKKRTHAEVDGGSDNRPKQ